MRRTLGQGPPDAKSYLLAFYTGASGERVTDTLSGVSKVRQSAVLGTEQP